MKALVLAGGGSKGAFEVGVMEKLICSHGERYDIITGVSVGALNASLMAMYSKRDQAAGVEHLGVLWRNLNTSKVYKRWFPFGKLHGLWRKSLYNSSPLQDLVRSTLDLERLRNSDVETAVGAVSLNTSEYHLFTPSDDDFVEGVLASSAFPIFLNPINTRGQWWSDGGLRNITPLRAAIRMGATEADIIIPSPPLLESANAKNALGIGLRSLEILLHEVQVTDLQATDQVNRLVAAGASDKVLVSMRIFQPTQNLQVNSLDFSPEDILRMLSEGHKASSNPIFLADT